MTTLNQIAASIGNVDVTPVIKLGSILLIMGGCTLAFVAFSLFSMYGDKINDTYKTHINDIDEEFLYIKSATISAMLQGKFMARLKDPYYQNRDLFKELNIKL